LVKAGNVNADGYGLRSIVEEVAELWKLDTLNEEGTRSLKELLRQRLMLAEVEMAIACRERWAGIAGSAHERGEHCS
jgi:hypothetical protein